MIPIGSNRSGSRVVIFKIGFLEKWFKNRETPTLPGGTGRER
jgi:hypothetical protein